MRSSHSGVLHDRLAERDSLGEPTAHGLEGNLGLADDPHGMMNAAGPESSLGNLEATALAFQHVGDRHADVVVHNFRVTTVPAMRIAEHRCRTDQAHARRRARNEDHRLLTEPMGGGVGLPHDDEQFAVRMVRAGRPPLPAIDDVFVALASDFGFDVGRVRRGDTWLGHRVSRADFAVHQRSEPAIFLLARAVALQHLHVAGVGRRAVEHLRSPDDPAHHFREGRVFQVRQAPGFRT